MLLSTLKANNPTIKTLIVNEKKCEKVQQTDRRTESNQFILFTTQINTKKLNQNPNV